ncbi:MAG TPA: hypothetical protein PLE42_03695 [Candidatus Competibacteraceae bacterium]|nr:MAG: hypothetical protein EKK69_13660 [Candidatus Competibacteraceae bacterium]HQC71803.1 hypothetical protein [Candidatus Competibacteraceae bacterium]
MTYPVIIILDFLIKIKTVSVSNQNLPIKAARELTQSLITDCSRRFTVQPATQSERQATCKSSMSDSTTFEFLVAPEQLNAFSDALAALMEPSSCNQLSASNAAPSRSLVHLFHSLATGKGAACLTLIFPKDPPLREFQSDNPELRCTQPGKVAVGCFWLSCQHAQGQYTIAFTSATRSISSLMQTSISVQHVFRTLAQHTMDGRIQLINEWNETAVL